MKKIFVMIMVLVAATAAQAQNEILVTAAGGMNTLNYAPANGDRKVGLGGNVGVQYEYMFNGFLGVTTGLGASMATGSSLFNYTEKKDAVHPDNGEKYQSTVKYNDLKEKQTMIAVSVPVQLLTRVKVSEVVTLQLAAGVSAMMPVYMKYSLESGSYDVGGYFPSIHGSVDYLEGHGFGKHEAGESGDIEHKGVVMGLKVDLGTSFTMSDNADLYTGLYLENTLNPLYKGGVSEQFSGSTLKYVSVLNSSQVEKVSALMVGLKVGIRFKFW